MNSNRVRTIPFHPTTFVDVLQWRASQQRERVALTFLLDGEHTAVSLTYAQLHQQAKSLASALRTKISAGERALLLYQPGMEYITAFLGCLYAGVIAIPAYLPSPNRPPLRLQAIVQDAQPTLVLSTGSLQKQLQRQFAALPLLAQLDWLLTDPDMHEAAPVPSPISPPLEKRATAFLQYTSGSTSAPKGVMVSHANLLANLEIMHHYLAVEEENSGVSWLPPYHDMGLIGGILLPIYSGAHMTLLSPVSFLQKPRRWLEAISRTRATVSVAPDFAYALCARKIPPEQRVGLDLSHWRIAVVGAEPVRPTTLAEFSTAFAACQFRPEAFQPCYGLAEATLMASSKQPLTPPVIQLFDATSLQGHTVKQADQHTEATRAFVSCGQSVIGQQIAIVAPDTGKRCDDTHIGEIWVQGPGVAEGYWNQPERSKETFQASLVESNEGPFLRTGDLGFFHQGELYITGRLKDLIILHGRNHYPQDLELTAQQSHPLLTPGAGAAFSIEQNNEEKLVLIHEIERQYRHQTTDLNEVVGAIRSAIWDQHELDVYVVVLLKPGSLLKTSSGKIQRRACREAFLGNELSSLLISSQEQRRKDVAHSAVAARTPQEEVLTMIWRDILEIEHIGVFDRFVDLGGDSLQASQIVSRIRDTFHLELPLQDLLASPTIAEQANQIEQAKLTDLKRPLPPIEAIQRSGSTLFPLSYAQERMWFFEQTIPGSTGPGDNIPIAVRLKGPVQISAFIQCIEEIICRHDILRTTFNTADEVPQYKDSVYSLSEMPGEQAQDRVFQVIHSYQKQRRTLDSANDTPMISLVDLTVWPGQKQEREVTKLLREEQYLVFNLRTGPLFRVKIIQLMEQEWVLLLNAHHSIFDGWSIGVFIQELLAFYEAFTQGQPSPLPELPLQYGDYARWQRQWLQGEVLQHKLAYWQQQLAGIPNHLNLPTDFTRPAVRSFAGKRYSFPFTQEIQLGIQELNKHEGVTLFTVLLTAYTLLLYRQSGQSDIVVGSMFADRTRVEIEKLLGLFINPVALRTKIDHGTITFRELLHRVQATTLAASTYQDTPFQYVVEQAGLQPDPAYTPLFQVMLTLQDMSFSKGREQIPGVTIQPLGDEWVDWAAELAPCDLELHILEETHGGLRGNLYYSTDLFMENTVQRLMEQFLDILKRAISNPEQQIQDM